MPNTSPAAPIGSSHRMLNQLLPMRTSGTRAMTGGIRRDHSATATRSAAEDSSVSSGSGALSGSEADAARLGWPFSSGVLPLPGGFIRRSFASIYQDHFAGKDVYPRADRHSCVAHGPRGLARRVRPFDRRSVIELVVEVDRGADQRQVAEGLREVAELLAGAADFLGVQAEMVGVGVHLLEAQPCVVEPPGPGQRVDVEERAQRERALIAVQPVG